MDLIRMPTGVEVSTTRLPRPTFRQPGDITCTWVCIIIGIIRYNMTNNTLLYVQGTLAILASLDIPSLATNYSM